MNQYFRTCSRIPRNTWIAILFFDKEELDQRPMRTIPSHLQCKKPFTNGRTKRAVCKHHGLKLLAGIETASNFVKLTSLRDQC